MRRSVTLVEVLLVLASLGEALWTVEGSLHCKQSSSGKVRPHSVTITEFGAVGDGVTLNTKAFQNAIFYIQSFADKGGAQLFVPAGRWLTGSFELDSHLTLLLDKNAVILGSTDSEDWPILDPLPSYGRGRELPGRRHQSLIYGNNLTDVIITGHNGTIDGQGDVWWNWFRNKTLNHTRPHLIELINSTGVLVSNLNFLNPPFWTIHPVYCRFVPSRRINCLLFSYSSTFSFNVQVRIFMRKLRVFFWMDRKVVIQNVTISAPLDSPNTDGIDPDSSEDVCIEDCHIRTGDDLVAIKSGWDEYGISYARPSKNIIIRRISGESGSGAGIAIGSEMSGGVSEVHAEGLQYFNSKHGIRIKTAPGRGGYVKNIYISDVTLTNVNIAIRFSGNYGEHPDESYDPKALPTIDKITIKDVKGENIKVAGLLEGIKGDSFLNICLSNISLNVNSKSPWNCSFIQGYSNLVSPEICEPLREEIFPEHSSDCYHLSNHLRSGAAHVRSYWLVPR